MTKQHFISVAVTDSELENYTLSAKLLGKSRSGMIREAIVEYLEKRSKPQKGFTGKKLHNGHALYAQPMANGDLLVLDYYTPKQNFLQPGWYLARRPEGAIRNVQGEKLDYLYYFHADIDNPPTKQEFLREVMQIILTEA